MTDYPQQLIDTLTDHGEYAERTIRFYREQSGLVLKVLREVNPMATPENLSVDDLKKLVRLMRSRYAVSTQKDYTIALKRMCEINDNFVFQKYRVMYPTDTRPNVDWLSFDQAKELLDMWKTPLEEIIVCLELLHGFRRIEVLRLRLQDIHLEDGYLEVRGKGRAGGKLRTVPIHPDFKRSYDRWMDERNEICRHGEFGTKHSDRLLVYEKGGQIEGYEEVKGRAIDKHLQELSERLGIEFSNHTLRRTFGRELFRSGVSIEVIATIYGHSSTTQTMKYLGLNLDDMASAMDLFKLRRRLRVVNGQNCTADRPSENRGTTNPVGSTSNFFIIGKPLESRTFSTTIHGLVEGWILTIGRGYENSLSSVHPASPKLAVLRELKREISLLTTVKEREITSSMSGEFIGGEHR